MAFVIPDPRWEMPALLTPKQHPLGPLEIDWMHPLTQNLQHAIVFNGRLPQDLVTGRMLTPVNGIKQEGNGHFFDTTTDAHYILPNVTLYKNVTIATRMYHTGNTVSQSRYILGHGTLNSSNTLNWYLISSSAGTNSNRLQAATGAVGRTMATDYWPTYNGLNIMFSSDGNTSGGRFFVDGELFSGTGSNTSWGVSSVTRDLYIGARNDAQTDRILDGRLWYLFIWNEYTSSSSHPKARLGFNPYQFVIPA